MIEKIFLNHFFYSEQIRITTFLFFILILILQQVHQTRHLRRHSDK